MGVFSDVGGLCGTLTFLVSIIAIPYGEHSYILSQISSVYFVNLKSNHEFLVKNEAKI